VTCLASNKSLDLERFTITDVMLGTIKAAGAEAGKSVEIWSDGWLAIRVDFSQ